MTQVARPDRLGTGSRPRLSVALAIDTLALLLLSSCGGPASDTATTPNVAVPPPDASVLEPAPPREPDSPVSGESLHILADNPEALSGWLDSRRGLTVIRRLHCMRSEEDQVESNQHECEGVDGVLRALYPNIQLRVRRALAPDGGGIECAPSSVPSVSECVLPPDSECVSRFSLYFQHGTLKMIVERDDWQSPDPVRKEFDAQITQQLEKGPEC